MVEIVVRIDNTNSVAPGAIVTGWGIGAERPTQVVPVEPTTLTRIYRGYGQLRAETGKAPRRGFGTLISAAQLLDIERNAGVALWLRVQD